MLFTELRFFPFFLAVFLVHWALRTNGPRKAWLLVTSYAFYAAWDWRFLSLIVASTLVDYVVALKIASNRDAKRRWLVLSLATNLGLLGFFKYQGFFVESAADLLRALGFQASLPVLNVVLPVGISFYTFQTLSYTLDVYFGRLQPTRKLLDVAVFVAFFPQLVAGPIVRAAEFLPQLEGERRLARVDVRAALVLFLSGFVKKACVSDNVAPLVDAYFEGPALYDAASAWLATALYTVQIYCDFSGYSDMAIACAALLGYRLCRNFEFPYFARDIADFWRRWHISLSSWLRDYLYIPLGGNRGSQLATYRNLLLTMLLGGLWHGAAWTFVCWGALHGVALALHRLWRKRAGATAGRLGGLLGVPLTLAFVMFCWVFFRAQGFPDALATLRGLAFSADGTQSLSLLSAWLLPPLALAHWIAWRFPARAWWRAGPSWAFGAAYGVAWALVLSFVPPDTQPFIYFQF